MVVLKTCKWYQTSRLVKMRRTIDEHASPVLVALGWRDVGDLVRRRDCVRVFGTLRDMRAP